MYYKIILLWIGKDKFVIIREDYEYLNFETWLESWINWFIFIPHIYISIGLQSFN